MYHAQLMPDHLDYDDDEEAEDDYDEDAEDDDDENGSLPELGLPTQSSGQGMSLGLLNIISSLTFAPDIHAEFMSPIASFERVQQWRVAAQ